MGALADLACISSHETKNVMCGEGGALLVNRPEWVERAEVVQEKGTNRSRFFRGEVEKYTWVDLGSSYVVSDISAAFLWAQLQEERAITAKRLALWDAYHEAFEDLEARAASPSGRPGALFTQRTHVLRAIGDVQGPRPIHSTARRIGSARRLPLCPLHSSPAGLRTDACTAHSRSQMTRAERLLRLPLWVGMSEGDVARVVDAVRKAMDAAT